MQYKTFRKKIKIKKRGNKIIFTFENNTISVQIAT